MKYELKFYQAWKILLHDSWETIARDNVNKVK